MHVRPTAGSQQTPGSQAQVPTLSVLFAKCSSTLPLDTPPRHKGSSGRRFWSLQQETKEKGFGVNPEIPREFIPGSHSLPSLSPPWRPGFSGTTHSLRAGHLQVFAAPR